MAKPTTPRKATVVKGAKGTRATVTNYGQTRSAAAKSAKATRVVKKKMK